MAGLKDRTALQRPSKAQRDADPYNPAIVEDILGGLSEWRSVQDVVRITFKALADVVKVQGTAIRDLELQLPGKAAKSDLIAQLALKTDRVDWENALRAVEEQLEVKVEGEELSALLEDKVSKSDLQLALRSKADSDQLPSLLTSKADLSLFQRDMRDLSQRLEACRHDTSDQLQNSASKAEIAQLKEEIGQKADKKEVERALEEKAGTVLVTNALKRKADRADVDNGLARKVEMAELQAVLEALKGKADCGTVEKLGQSLGTKPDREEIATSLVREVGKLPQPSDLEALSREVQRLRQDLEERLQQQSVEIRTYSSMLQKENERLQASLSLSLGKKADSRSFDYLSSSLQLKVDKDQLAGVLASVRAELHEGFQSLAEENKAVEAREKGRLQEACEHQAGQYGKLEEELGRVKEAVRAVADRHKGELEDTIKYLRSDSAAVRGEFQAQLQALSQQVTAVSQSKADLSAIRDLRAALPTAVFDPQALAGDLAALKRDFTKEIEAVRREVETVCKAQRERRDWEGAKALTEAIGRKAGLDDFERLQAQVERLGSELGHKADSTDLESHIQYTQGALQEIGKDLLLTGDLSTLQTAVDHKANIDEVNSALAALNSQLDCRLVAQVQEQTLINEALCGENCCARFIWKSGDLRADSTIPWEVQSVNMCPENYIWEEDRPAIVVVAPGLYEVLIGVFARKPPGVRVLVNGETILGVGEGQRQVTRHSAGNVAGTTAVEFLALPAKSRLSLVYSGDSGGEGFLGLRKL